MSASLRDSNGHVWETNSREHIFVKVCMGVCMGMCVGGWVGVRVCAHSLCPSILAGCAVSHKEGSKAHMSRYAFWDVEYLF